VAIKSETHRPRAKYAALGLGAATLLVLAGIALGNGAVHAHGGISFGASEQKHEHGKATNARDPLEFLLLDTARIDSYLPQLTNGDNASEHLHQKVVNSANAGIDVNGLIKGGAETQKENFVEREVTPTATSRLIALEAELRKDGLIESEGELHKFEASLKGKSDGEREANVLEEGDMVRFKAAVRAPEYIEPYLAVSREATISALFPDPSRGRSKRRTVKRQRKAVGHFRKQVGPNPRLLLTAHPEQAGSKKNDVTVLMPVRMKQLSEERSLLRTGGLFTVLGKVIRIFSPVKAAIKERGRANAYVDLSTLHTWLQPIRNAPRELICKANLTCETEVETSGGAVGTFRRQAAKKARKGMVRSLKREIRIDREGGLIIVPIAIYR